MEEKLSRWQGLPKPEKQAALDAQRWVVVDVESSGLNVYEDRLIAIGAVALHGTSLALSDSFEIVLKQETASSVPNILVHGIGDAAQTGGTPPQTALLAFLQYLQNSILVAFHAPFDEIMIRRAMEEHLNFSFKHTWLDLAFLAPALFPHHPEASDKGLDGWLEYFHITNAMRHNALADAVATAELFMVLLQEARKHGISNCEALLKTEKAQRWLTR
jgi:DNA polymerase-3 subunit epsilon